MPVTEDGLRFLLSADVADFERAQRDALKAAENAAAGIVRAGKNIAGSADYVKTLQTQLKSFANDIKNGEGRFVAFGASVDKNGKIVQNFSKSAGNASTTLFSLTRIAQDAPFGFIAIQNNIAETVSQFGALVKTSGGVGNALKAVGTQILGPGGVLLGINLLITGITALVQRYGSLSAAADALLNPLNEQARIQKVLSSTILQGQKDAQQELVIIDKLYRAATNLNIPLSERNKIVDEIQKRYPAYFKNLSNEEILTGKAADAYKRLREQIIATATSRAIDKELEKQGAAEVELLQKQHELEQQVVSTTATLKKQELQLSGLSKEAKGFDRLALGEQYAELQAKVAGSTRGLQLANLALADNKKAQDEIKKAQNSLLDIQDQLIKKFGAVTAGVEENSTKTRTARDVLADLQKELAAISAQFKTINFSLDSINEQKIGALNKAFIDLVTLGVSPASSEIQNIISQINLLAASIQDVKGLDTKQIFQFNKQTIADPNGLKSERLVLRLPIEVNRDEILKGAQGAAAALRAGINFIHGDFSTAADTLRKQITDILNGSLVSGIGSIASAIGTALGTGQINSIFSAFANSIGGFLEEMGKVLIANGIAIEAFKTSLESFQGAPAIIAGAALVIAGSAFRAFVSKGADSFATGGTIYGPSNVIAGDNPEGYKEHILSDLQLQKLGRDAGMGGGSGFIAETRIELTQLVIGLKRAGYSISRIN
jgi:hypothetical protein